MPGNSSTTFTVRRRQRPRDVGAARPMARTLPQAARRHAVRLAAPERRSRFPIIGSAGEYQCARRSIRSQFMALIVLRRTPNSAWQFSAITVRATKSILTAVPASHPRIRPRGMWALFNLPWVFARRVAGRVGPPMSHPPRFIVLRSGGSGACGDVHLGRGRVARAVQLARRPAAASACLTLDGGRHIRL